MKKRRAIIIIIVIIIGSTSITLIADSLFRIEYKNPFRVAKAFCFSYLKKDPEHMKLWADKETHEKIDELEYSNPVEDFRMRAWEDFELVGWRRLGDTVVSTYAYNRFEGPHFLYSAVLKPLGQSSLWERVKEFIYFDIPFGDKIVGFPHGQQRWAVVDFFTSDSDAYQKYFDTFYDKTDFEALDLLISELLEDLDVAIDKRLSYEDSWAKAEKVRQNEEIKKLYSDYKEVCIEEVMLKKNAP